MNQTSPPPTPPPSTSGPPAAPLPPAAARVPAAAPSPPRPNPTVTHRGEDTSWYQPLLWIGGQIFSRIASLLIFRLRVFDVRHVPAAKGQPALLITNHQSFLDPWLIAIAPGRQIHYMARDTLFQGGFMHWMMETHNTFPVKRGHGDRASIRVAAERLEKGYIVNIFPEGTRSLDGTIGPIAPGLSLILRGCKRPVPVIPVLIDGAFEAWPRTKKLPRPHAIKVIYGSPITPEEIAGLSAGELAVRIRRELVALQAKVGSVHAEASARRLATEGSERPRV